MKHEIGSEESISMVVVRAVSAIENRAADQLPPLGDVLDPDALDTLFGHHYDGRPRIGGHLSFVYSGCRVTVDHGEYLTVEEIEPDPHHLQEGAGAS